MLIFSLSGLRYGVAVSYIVLGLLNGIYQATGNFVRAPAAKMHLAKRRDAETFSGGLLLAIILLFWVDGKKDRGINVAERFLAQVWWFGVTAELALIVMILLSYTENRKFVSLNEGYEND